MIIIVATVRDKSTAKFTGRDKRKKGNQSPQTITFMYYIKFILQYKSFRGLCRRQSALCQSLSHTVTFGARQTTTESPPPPPLKATLNIIVYVYIIDHNMIDKYNL